MRKIRLEYFGTRGSIPSPGPNTLEFGGNTTCLYLELVNGDEIEQRMIIDAGTGIRNLGNQFMGTELGKGQGTVYMLVTHTHWDHIQGFPFFTPAYIPGNEIHIFGRGSGDSDLAGVLAKQQSFENFPVPFDKMGASIQIQNITSDDSIDVGQLKVSAIDHAHPGGSLGYKIKFEDIELVFCTDVEHLHNMSDRIADFAKGASLLAYDSQYYEEEYEKKVGWGHSIKEVAVKIAKKAGVGELHLIHHDPERTDQELATIEKETQQIFSNTHVAREGMVREFSTSA